MNSLVLASLSLPNLVSRLPGGVAQGIIWGIMALGVYITFRLLDVADLTVDGSFTTGGAVTVMLIIAGWPAWAALLAAVVAGLLAGLVTGLLHTKLGIPAILAGILTQFALYSINLRIMDGANIPLLRQQTLFTPLRENGLLGTWVGAAILLGVVLVLGLVVVWFLTTDLGLSIRATGDNGPMLTSFGVSTDYTKTLTLALSNGFVGMCGALVGQYQGFADISMGIGLILVGLASVIMGQAILGQRFLWLAVLAVIVGAVLYRIIIFLALQVGLDPNDMKLITALLVIVALLVPRWKGLTSRFRPAAATGAKVAA